MTHRLPYIWRLVTIAGQAQQSGAPAASSIRFDFRRLMTAALRFRASELIDLSLIVLIRAQSRIR